MCVCVWVWVCVCVHVCMMNVCTDNVLAQCVCVSHLRFFSYSSTQHPRSTHTNNAVRARVHKANTSQLVCACLPVDARTPTQVYLPSSLAWHLLGNSRLWSKPRHSEPGEGAVTVGKCGRVFYFVLLYSRYLRTLKFYPFTSLPLSSPCPGGRYPFMGWPVHGVHVFWHIFVLPRLYYCEIIKHHGGWYVYLFCASLSSRDQLSLHTVHLVLTM